jgi:hypothetical protein
MQAEGIPRQVQRLPHIYNYEHRDSSIVQNGTSPFGLYDACLYNCYPEVIADNNNGTKETWIRGRPGQTALAKPAIPSITDTNVGGMYWWAYMQQMAIVVNGSVYFGNLDTNTWTIVPGLTLNSPKQTRFVEKTATVALSDGKLILLDPGTGHVGNNARLIIFTASTTAFTTVALPTVTGPLLPSLVLIDNYVLTGDPYNVVWNSNLNDPTTWNSSSFFTPDTFPDNLVGIERTLNYVVAFKNYSIDFLYDAANPTLTPLGKIPGLTIYMGCTNGESIKGINNSIYFLGQTQAGFSGVYSLTNVGQLQKISTPAVDRAIKNFIKANYANTGLVISGDIFQLDHHTFYYLPQVNLMYCIDSNTWVPMGFTNSNPKFFSYVFPINSNIYTAISITGSTKVGRTYCLGTDGTVSELSNTSYQDLSLTSVATPILRGIQTPRVDFGTTKRKYFTRVELLGDLNGNTISLTAWDDDYTTLSSTGRTVTMSYPRGTFYNSGSSRRRAWAFSTTDNNPFRISGLEVEFELGDD